MTTCPCCSNSLLRHARGADVYWFCSHCWQEMPDLPSDLSHRRSRGLQVASLERLIRNDFNATALR
ncbi:MAG: hypothetical protein ACTS2F_05245 [Thainema sp.]